MTVAMQYWEARARAVSRAIDADPSIVMVSGYFSAPFNPPDGLIERHADRIVQPPISEMAQCGFGVGAAMGGLRPLVSLNTSSFMFYGWPQIVNEAPNVRYLSGGRVTAPVVFHILAGSRRSSGPQHEHEPQAMLHNVPGLRIFAPATPADVDGLVHAAFHGDDPVVLVDHLLLAHATGPIPSEPDDAICRADLVREGGDVVLVAYSVMTQRAMAAADVLGAAGIRASVLNLRTLAPLPVGDVLRVVADHPAAVFVDEAHGRGSTASYLMARVLEERPATRARLVCMLDAPAPFAEELLDVVVPTADRIAADAAALLGRSLPG
ncbi:MAG: alpha-ketoacid dehydrogenase subunit beta [Actinomycetota bacterium]